MLERLLSYEPPVILDWRDVLGNQLANEGVALMDAEADGWPQVMEGDEWEIAA